MSSPRQGILAYPLSGQERGWQGQEGGEGISSRWGRLDSTRRNGEKDRVDIGAARWVQRIRRKHLIGRNLLKLKGNLEGIQACLNIFRQSESHDNLDVLDLDVLDLDV